MAVLVFGHLRDRSRCACCARRACSRGASTLGALLLAQVALGIANVKLGLPLHVAVAHNAGAALLLFVLVSLRRARARAGGLSARALARSPSTGR